MKQIPEPTYFNFGDLGSYSQASERPELEAAQVQEIGECDDYTPPRLRIGETFNPYRQFNENVLIPGAMSRSRELQPGAKLVYGRLRWYAGEDGRCYPALKTLATEVALGKRQVQKHLRTLEKTGFLRTEVQFKDGRQTSNSYIFVWHRIFAEEQQTRRRRVNSSSLSPVHSSALRPVNRDSHKEGHSEEGYAEETRSLPSDAHSHPSKPSQYFNLGNLSAYSSEPEREGESD